MGSITNYIHNLQDGDTEHRNEASTELWRRFVRQLIGKARAQLSNVPRRAADEEDVALSAFDSLYRGLEEGRFPNLNDRDDLWKLLVMIAIRKAADLRKHSKCQKRDFRREAPLIRAGADEDDSGDLLVQLIDSEPDPALAAELVEQVHARLGELDDEQMHVIAVRKMEGWKNLELAEQLGISVATVERQLRRIRGRWSRHVAN